MSPRLTYERMPACALAPDTAVTELSAGIDKKTKFESKKGSQEAEDLPAANDDESLSVTSSQGGPSTSSDDCIPNKTVVMKGFGSYIPPMNESAIVGAYSFFPPDSNSAYTHDKYGTVADRSRPLWKPSFDGVAFVKKQIEQNKSRDKDLSVSLPNATLVGENLAEKIQWERYFYSGGEVAGAGQSTSPLLNMRSQYIKQVNELVMNGQELYMFCNRCQRRHIPPGPNLALGDRDTCFSMLPEWFPRDKFPHAWEEFIELMNDIVRLSEIENGWMDVRSPPAWEKNYHEASLHWGEMRKWGGWWKCRSAADGEGIPEAEKHCRKCHQQRNEISTEERLQRLALRRKEMEEWIANRMKAHMVKDKEIVQLQLRAEGY